MASDRPDEPAQMSPDLGVPLGRLAGRSTAVMKRPSPSNTDHGLEAVFVIVGIEQAQLLIAVNAHRGIVVDVEHDWLGSLSERGAVLDQGPSHAHQTASIGMFSRRESVGCEARSRSDGRTSCAILKIGSERRLMASLPSA